MKSYIYQNSKIFIAVGLVVVFVLGVAVGQITGPFSNSSLKPTNKVLREDGYQYVRPVLLCNTETDISANEDQSLKRGVSGYVDKATQDKIAVYYLNLTNGQWAGVNENETFSPASMLKVPTAAAILKYSESHADILTKEVYYDGSFDLNKGEYFKSTHSIRPGHSYTVEQLLDYTIAGSDNNALKLLHNIIDDRDFASIYINLGIQIPADAISELMSPKTYSLFLRLFYNGTYLNNDLSEKLMELMAKPDFPSGLTSVVPKSVQVAQKFGERQIINTDGTVQDRELHDCGIIYAPNNPYILCVMTRGDDFSRLTSDIHDISKLVYDQVTKQ